MTLNKETIRIRNRILTMVKRRTPYYQQGQCLDGLRPLMHEVREMVRRLCNEINTAPIESIVTWHKDVRPNYDIKKLIRYIRHRRKTRHKGEYFDWEYVLASMWLRPHEIYFPCVHFCPDCGKWTVIANVYTPAWTWRYLMGRGGMMIFCPHCKKQIKYILIVMN